MNARFFDPLTGMFISPDTMVPDAGLVFAYNRYMYVYGWVMNANDPRGHAANDKAITAGDGAGTASIVFFEYDNFVCSQDVCQVLKYIDSKCTVHGKFIHLVINPLF